MIVEEQAVPAPSEKSLLPVREALLQAYQRQRRQIPLFLSGLLIQTDVFKLEHHAQLAAVGSAVKSGALDVGTPCLARGDDSLFPECLAG